MLAVSGMVKAGVPIPSILRTLQRGATPWYQERIAHTLWHVNNGLNLGEALHRSGFGFPDVETVKDLRAYAALDGFDERSEEHTSEPQSLMRISYAVFCLTHKNYNKKHKN